jgi:KipI family sensor histidine kinase inhibitor
MAKQRMLSTMKLSAVGEGALLLSVGDTTSEDNLARVQAAVPIIEQEMGDALVDLVPSYASVLILYEPLEINRVQIARRLRRALHNLPTQPVAAGAAVVLPVYYAAESGADLPSLAERAQLSVEEFIDLHANTEYRVYAIGFAPGFAYLGQVDERIAAPRLATPRAKVPRGSVAIADRQTAIYPAESPGGWNLIGRCPVPMFDARATPIMPVAVGDRVWFEPISRERYLACGGELP